MNPEKKNQIPIIESKVFVGHPDIRFAIGEVAVNGAVVNGYCHEFAGAAQLRAKTYLDSGFINSDELDDDGTELDQNDSRSAHFVVLERTASDLNARVVGNMRLIIKSSENFAPLPVEGYYPELFSDNPFPVNSVEVSRLIARHEDPLIQNILKWPLFVAGYKYAEHNKLGSVYGLISPALTRQLRMEHVPVAAVAAEKYIPAINATKQPVVLNFPLFKRLIESTGDQGIDVTNGGFSYLKFTNVVEDGIS